MKYLCVDYGSKRVGVAVSDDDGLIAFPRATLPNDESLVRTLAGLAKIERVRALVVGDTRSTNGRENPVTRHADEFMHALREETSLPIKTIFESWSTIEAGRYAPPGKEHDDAAAAAFLLQRYLDIHRSA